MRIGRQELFVRCGVEGETPEVWLAQRWIAPQDPQADACFGEADVARGRLIRELTRDLGVNEAGVDVIPHLMDQKHDLRRALREIRARGP